MRDAIIELKGSVNWFSPTVSGKSVSFIIHFIVCFIDNNPVTREFSYDEKISALEKISCCSENDVPFTFCKVQQN